MATGPYGSLCFPLNQMGHWKKKEIMKGGKITPPQCWYFVVSSKAHCNKRCPDMVTVSRGRDRHCCPNKQNKWLLTPSHLPDLQLGMEAQKQPSKTPEHSQWVKIKQI